MATDNMFDRDVKIEKPTKMTLDKIEKEAFMYIGNADENAEIIPDGKINEAANLMANFIHHLWEIDVVYEPSV